MSRPYGGMGIRAPIEDAPEADVRKGIEKGWYVTAEVVAIYLICVIYYEDVEFAQVPYMSGKRPVLGGRYNTPQRIQKAWSGIEKWTKKLDKYGIAKLRQTKEHPLKSAGLHFYGQSYL